jgi:hypothetical protein
MNELIKKFFVQSGGSIRIDEVTKDEWTYTENLDVEKFARLIQTECMDVCENVGTSGDGQYCVDAIYRRLQ